MAELKLAVEEKRGAGDVLATWFPRIALALVFLNVGYQKFGADPMWVRIFERIGLGDWFRYLTGAMQVGGALLLLVPPLVTLGAAILACTMAGAIVTNLFVLHSGLAVIIPSALFVAIVIVGVAGFTASSEKRSARDDRPESA